jgi:beta-galactosidase
MNGLLAADRTPHPGLSSVKYFYQYVKVDPLDWEQGKFIIHNRFDFMPLNKMLCGRWEILENGKVIYSDTLQGIDIAPQQKKEIILPLSNISYKQDREYYINFLFTNCKETFYAHQNFEIGWEQFRMPESTWHQLKMLSRKIKPLSVNLNTSHITVAGESFYVVFDILKGKIESYNLDGSQIITSGPEIDFWRAPTDNDIGALRSDGNIDMFIWKGAHQSLTRNILINGESYSDGSFSNSDLVSLDEVEIKFELDLPYVNAFLMVKYDIFQDGTVDVTTNYQPGDIEDITNFIPRFGNRMELAPGFDKIEWYGRGPNPTYADRKTERVGLYQSTVTDEWVEYSRPQENGYKTDVRWFKITQFDGKGLKFIGDSLICFGVSHYDRTEVENNRYTYEMEASNFIFLNIDHKQMGVGGYDSWSSNGFPVEEFRVYNKPMGYRFRIEPIR